MAGSFGAVGAHPFIGQCACLRRGLPGEPDVGNLHLRFDEGRAGRAMRHRLSYSTGPDCRLIGAAVFTFSETALAHTRARPRAPHSPLDSGLPIP
jgi:hypothetical protein